MGKFVPILFCTLFPKLMIKLLAKTSKTVGLPPGTPVHIGEKKNAPPLITIIDYDQNKFQEKVVQNLNECYPFRDSPTITWINVDGIQDVEMIQKLDAHFGVHPLVVEDVVNTSQRPKIEDFGDNIFFVFKMLYTDHKTGDIISEQVSVIFGTNYVISFQETEGYDVFNTIRERLRTNKGRVRKMGADYLAYCLLDCVVDHYFFVLEHLGEQIEGIEEEIMAHPGQNVPRQIHVLIRDLIFLRKQVWPLRELINNFQRIESKLIKKTTEAYLRDVYDHAIQVIDTIESFRDMLAGLQDIYLSTISHKLNEVMKILTIISTVFIPLTFIASLYGMNFKHIPSASSPTGFYDALAFMAAITIIMLIYFQRRKWL